MDSDRFDLVARTFAASGSRRRLLAGFLAGAAGFVGSRGTEARTCSAIGAVCREHANCCSAFCGPKDRTGRRRCQCDADADCPENFACEQGACVQTCVPSNTCTTNADCCGDLSCSGGITANMICQDCDAAPTVAGNACGATQGNQCCGGNPNCFVAVTIGGDPVCASGGECNTVTPCASDADCPTAVGQQGTICVRNDSPGVGGCCTGSPPPATICVTPCGGGSTT